MTSSDPPSPDAPAALFRAEAQREGNALHGTILLARPVSFAVLTALAAAIVAALLAFILCFSASATARLPGVLTPSGGVLRVVADRAGRVVERRVAEGQSVRAGDGLFLLGSERGDARGGSTDAAVSRLIAHRRDSLIADTGHRQAQGRQRLAALRDRIAALDGDLRRLEDEHRLSHRRVELDRAALDRQHALQAHGMSTASAAQEREAALIDARQRLSQQERASAAARRERAAVLQDARDLELQLRRDDESAARSLAAIEQELAEHDGRREVLIRAPRAGVVSALRAEPGQSVAAGELLAQLWPADGELEADLRAPSHAAAFLAPGMAVRLHLDAFPHQKFGAIEGRVRDVDLIASEPAAAGEPPAYRVRVRLPRQSLSARGADHALRPGMTLEAVAPLERRRLYEWLIDPLKQLGDALSPPDAGH
ncbi:HlyD family efflux transporter periplasmic adaptor subunit [Roseateles sp.]|uniref:HlyD family secretion protein n=1 Tax=Roseateles sp. TaxID=1971397 RepID=UPI0031CDEA2A